MCVHSSVYVCGLLFVPGAPGLRAPQACPWVKRSHGARGHNGFLFLLVLSASVPGSTSEPRVAMSDCRAHTQGPDPTVSAVSAQGREVISQDVPIGVTPQGRRCRRPARAPSLRSRRRARGAPSRFTCPRASPAARSRRERRAGLGAWEAPAARVRLPAPRGGAPALPCPAPHARVGLQRLLERFAGVLPGLSVCLLLPQFGPGETLVSAEPRARI